MKKRKFTVLFLTLFLISVSMVGQVQAATNGTVSSDTIVITPRWDNANDVYVYLNISSGTTEYSGMITGKAGTTNISATFKLEQKTSYGWTTVETWNESSNGSLVSITGTTSAKKGNTYRFSVTATVIRNGVSEMVSGISAEKSY